GPGGWVTDLTGDPPLRGHHGSQTSSQHTNTETSLLPRTARQDGGPFCLCAPSQGASRSFGRAWGALLTESYGVLRAMRPRRLWRCGVQRCGVQPTTPLNCATAASIRSAIRWPVNPTSSCSSLGAPWVT